METIKYTKELPPAKLAFGIIGIILSVLALIYGYIPIFPLIIVCYTFIREGSEINLHNKMYRTFYSFLGFQVGKWKPIPNFDYVSVFSTSETQQINIISAPVNVKSKVILLNLFYGNKHITFYKTSDADDAFKVANHFKVALDIDVLDATTRDKKWL